MTPARQRPPSRSDDSSNYLFYGLLALTSALFLAAAIAILREDEVRAASPPATPILAASRPAPTATATLAVTAAPPTSTVVPATATSAVVLVERRPPTQTPRVTAAPIATPTPVVASPTPIPAASLTPTEMPSATPTPIVVTATGTATPQPTATAAERIHIVRGGDSLQVIADLYGVPWQSIRDANNLPDGAILQIDQPLVIPRA